MTGQNWVDLIQSFAILALALAALADVFDRRR